jgi:hypothetical protein
MNEGSELYKSAAMVIHELNDEVQRHESIDRILELLVKSGHLSTSEEVIEKIAELKDFDLKKLQLIEEAIPLSSSLQLGKVAESEVSPSAASSPEEAFYLNIVSLQEE